MSRKAAIGALALAALLCATAYFLLGDRGGGGPVRPLFSFLPSEANRLAVHHPDGRAESAVRGPGGDWTIRVERSAAPAEASSWPANPTPVRSVLRLLTTLTPIRDAERGSSLDAGAARVEIGLDGGRGSIAFTLGSQPIGGRALVRIEDAAGPRTYWIDAGLAQSLVETGLLPWRDRALLPNFTRDVSRIRLTNAGGTLAIGKVTGRWGVREPVAAPADEASVQRLIATLAGLEITSYLDGPAAPASAAPPLAALLLESDQREPRASGEGFLTRTRRWTVEFREGGGLAGAHLLAAVACAEETNEPGRAPVITASQRYHVSVAAERLTELGAAPDAYVARASCQTPATDIGGVAITPAGGALRAFTRTLDGWNADGGVPCPPEQSRAISAVAAWLCGAPGDVTTRPPEGWVPAASVELRTLGGAPLVTVEVAARAGPDAPVMTRVGPVWRTYAPSDAAAAADWLLAAP